MAKRKFEFNGDGIIAGRRIISKPGAVIQATEIILTENAKRRLDEAVQRRQMINELPYIDPSVRYVGVSRLREMTSTVLKELREVLVIQDKNDAPLAVVLNYDLFLEMQSLALDRKTDRT